jgi:hypothetical protein
VAAGRPRPCSNGQRRLEVALGRAARAPHGRAKCRGKRLQVWASGCPIRLDVPALAMPVRGQPLPRPVAASCEGGALRVVRWANSATMIFFRTVVSGDLDERIGENRLGLHRGP